MEKIYTKCPICGDEHCFEVTEEQFKKYQSGEDYIQNIFPELSADEREMLITGICPSCWNKMFR